jgi:putative molybdopterin biosynthesis protein
VNPPPPTFYTVEQISQLLSVSKMSVYRLIERDELRHYRFGRSVRVRADDLNRYLRSADSWGEGS